MPLSTSGEVRRGCRGPLYLMHARNSLPAHSTPGHRRAACQPEACSTPAQRRLAAAVPARLCRQHHGAARPGRPPALPARQPLAQMVAARAGRLCGLHAQARPPHACALRVEGRDVEAARACLARGAAACLMASHALACLVASHAARWPSQRLIEQSAMGREHS